MKTLRILILIASGTILLISCKSFTTDGPLPAAGEHLKLSLEPGPTYRSTTSWFIFRLPIYPQVAVWMESPEGEFLGTLYATEKSATGSFISAPKAGRPEALPVWTGRKEASVDAVTSATSSGSTHADLALPGSSPSSPFMVYLETNRSYDYNDRYTRENSGVSGQPSLVYRAKIDPARGMVEAAFEAVGRGSVDGTDAEIHPDLDGIDSAFSLFSRMVVAYKE